MLWKLEWDYLPTRVLCFWLYRLLFKSITIQPWFQSLKISRAAIIKYTRLRTGHSLLLPHRPHHSYKMGFNSSSFPSPPTGPTLLWWGYCDFQHLLKYFPSFSPQRTRLKFFFSTHGNWYQRSFN